MISLDVGAADLEGGVVSGNVDEALGSLSWPYESSPEVPGLS